MYRMTHFFSNNNFNQILMYLLDFIIFIDSSSTLQRVSRNFLSYKFIWPYSYKNIILLLCIPYTINYISFYMKSNVLQNNIIK
jgi:hypothetical protein